MLRKIIFSSMVSLDGYIARPAGALDWVIIDDEIHTFVNQTQDNIDTYIYGRHMYETMSAYWPTAHLDTAQPASIHDYARIWQGMDKIVFSKTLNAAPPDWRLVKDDVAGTVKSLRAQSGKNIGLGGATLAAAFGRLGLIDEYELYVQPVVLGSGKPLFQGVEAQVGLKLLETTAFGAGVVYVRYGVV